VTWLDDVPAEHRDFAETAAGSQALDPTPTFDNLSQATGVPVEVLVHHALVRWASAGAEALMVVEPRVLRDLVDARRREDWESVAGLIDWLDAGR
jgi:hypothetical protein